MTTHPVLFRLGALLLLAAAAPEPALAQGVTYYVDSIGGQDSNSGTTQGDAWRTLPRVSSQIFLPADQVLFRRGASWTGELLLDGSGSAGAPIRVDAYGTGALPALHGAGVKATVYLKDEQYWELRNLELTNTVPGNTTQILRGVWVHQVNRGAVHGIVLEDLVIHDVTGTLNDKGNGGIFLRCGGTQTPTWFDGLRIENCRVSDCDRTGISLDSGWSTRDATANGNWTPSVGVVVRGNLIERAGQNGLIWRVSDAPLIEWNVLADCGSKGNGNAAFIANCDHALMQFNEAYGTILTDPSQPDAGGLDSDQRNKGAILQYNYCHDNDRAGMVVTCGTAATDFNHGTVLRYNILQNNGLQEIRLSGKPSWTRIHNNTIYVGSGQTGVEILRHKSLAGQVPENTLYFNNLFLIQSSSAEYELASSRHTRFEFNLFHGLHPTSEPADPYKLTLDPRLVAPGSGGLGFDSLAGYRLRFPSPAIDSGLLWPGFVGRDLWGVPVPVGAGVDRGASEFPFGQTRR